MISSSKYDLMHLWFAVKSTIIMDAGKKLNEYTNTIEITILKSIPTKIADLRIDI